MPKKLSVGKQLIYSAEEIHRIDPIWLFRRVPGGFWESRPNRKNYMLWLAHRLRFRYMKDWYRLRFADLAGNRGSGLANCCWHSSPIEAVKECFPRYEWAEWNFVKAPDRFWKNPSNRRRYMTWLGEQLGFRQMDDWYRVASNDISNHRGGHLLAEFAHSAAATVMGCFPEYDWKEWLFATLPATNWKDPKLRRRYMRWLGERLGYRSLDDWYRLRLTDLKKHHGGILDRLYNSSTSTLVMETIPRRTWCDWKFSRVPLRFWECRENRRRYMAWLGKQLSFRGREDWSRLRGQHLRKNHGGTLINRYHSMRELLADCFPEWNGDNACSSRSPEK